MDHRRAETCRCSLDDKLTLDHGWEIPPPDWSITTDPDILSHFGPELLEELAQRTWGPDKTCDFLLSPHAGVGKFTLSTVLAETLPGLVYRIDASELKDQRMAFSVHTKPLTNCRIVMYDEAARAGVKWTNTLYSMTDEDIDVNDKHRLEERLRRIGTPVFIGPDQPDLDAGQQGIAARVGAVWQLKAASGSVDATRRALWLSDTEKAKLRTWLLEVALRGPRNNDALDDHGAHRSNSWTMPPTTYCSTPGRYWRTSTRRNSTRWSTSRTNWCSRMLSCQTATTRPYGARSLERTAKNAAGWAKGRRNQAIYGLASGSRKPGPQTRPQKPHSRPTTSGIGSPPWTMATTRAAISSATPAGCWKTTSAPGPEPGAPRRAAQPARHEHHLLICEWLGHNLDGERCHDCHDLDDGRCQRDGAQDWMNSWEAAGRPLRLTASRISPDK